MASKLKIVVATQAKAEEEFLKTRPIAPSLEHLYRSCHIDFNLHTNNTVGLSTLYNTHLKDPANIDKTLVFVHDDVYIEDLFFEQKLLVSPYAITGVAGTRQFDFSQLKLAWHLASKSEDYVGECAHCKDDKVWTTVFGPTPSRALIIDGLLISVKVRDVVDREVEFDERFDWHFYDIAFCLRANDKQVTTGVVPLRVVHYGLGDSMLTPEWEKSNELFRQTYATA